MSRHEPVCGRLVTAITDRHGRRNRRHLFRLGYRVSPRGPEWERTTTNFHPLNIPPDHRPGTCRHGFICSESTLLRNAHLHGSDPPEKHAPPGADSCFPGRVSAPIGDEPPTRRCSTRWSVGD